MKKSIILSIFIFTLVGILTCSSCKYIVDDRASKEEIFSFVRENHEKLLNFPYDEYSKFSHSIDKYAFVEEYFDGETIITGIYAYAFKCGDASNLREFYEVGFYYSANDKAYVVGCSAYNPVLHYLEPGKYEWKSGNGTKVYFTEKIQDNFYYYSLWSCDDNGEFY